MTSLKAAILHGTHKTFTFAKIHFYRILRLFYMSRHFTDPYSGVPEPKVTDAPPTVPDGDDPGLRKIIIPDLVSHCTFEIHLNSHVDRAVRESKDWLFAGGNLTEKRKDSFRGLKAGELTSSCYPYAEFDQLRVCCDFMNYLFHLDDLSDDMDNKGTSSTGDEVMNTLYHPKSYDPQTRVGKMTKDYWERFTPTGSAGAQQRFMSTFDQFFQAITIQAVDRKAGTIPDLESYIAVRRDTSGCKPCWALIEYANNLDLPDEVMNDPIIQNLDESANDLVTWSNDIFSYNREQAKGDTHNMIVVVMKQYGLDLQSAVDFVGDMCKKSIDRFMENQEMVPSWGPEIDKQVQIYISGLADWIVGSLHWSFDSERYFGKNGQEVKATRIVNLVPRRTPMAA